MNKAHQKLSQKLAPVFERYPEIMFGYLFGSTAQSSQGPLSDIDLAIYVADPKKFSFSRKLQLHGDCCRVLARNDVDLVVLNQTRNIILLEEIVRNGAIILKRDQNKLDEFEVETIHQAIDFREHRKRMMGI